MDNSDQQVSPLGKPFLDGNSYQMVQSHRHADFDVNVMFLAEGDFIVITDLDKGNRSVTHDIKYVIEQLHHNADLNQPIDHYKIIYRDSMKRYDGIKTREGQFMSFYPLQGKELNEAVRNIKTVLEDEE